MKKILFVVHRYPPFPGGSENYVRDMAEEVVRRGHEAVVLTGEHKGDRNGVKVTSNAEILGQKWDLIVVHGGDVGVQDFVLNRSHAIAEISPMLFMLIIPSESETYKHACEHVQYIGCSAPEDWDWIKKKGLEKKAKRISHGIDERSSTGMPGFREKYGIKTELMFLSCGGYWPNKAMHELVDTFNQVGRWDITLVLTGYDNRYGLMPRESEYVRPLMIDDRNDVMSAIRESDLYIMHSHREGFGLVLLESMLNHTPWASRNIAGGRLMSNFGFTYDKDEELLKYMRKYKTLRNTIRSENAYEYVIHNHLIRHTVDDIMRLT